MGYSNARSISIKLVANVQQYGTKVALYRTTFSWEKRTAVSPAQTVPTSRIP